MSRRGLLAIAVVAAGCHHAKGPTAASCREAGAHVADAMRAVRPELAAAEVDPAPDVTATCTEDAWSVKVVACYKDAITPRQARACSEQLTDTQREHARAMQEALYKRASQVGDGSDGGGLPEICTAYDRLLDELDNCPNLSQPQRDGLRQAAEDKHQEWGELLGDGIEAERIEIDCQASLNQLQLSLAAVGC